MDEKKRFSFIDNDGNFTFDGDVPQASEMFPKEDETPSPYEVKGVNYRKGEIPTTLKEDAPYKMREGYCYAVNLNNFDMVEYNIATGARKVIYNINEEMMKNIKRQEAERWAKQLAREKERQEIKRLKALNEEAIKKAMEDQTKEVTLYFLDMKEPAPIYISPLKENGEFELYDSDHAYFYTWGGWSTDKQAQKRAYISSLEEISAAMLDCLEFVAGVVSPTLGNYYTSWEDAAETVLLSEMGPYSFNQNGFMTWPDKQPITGVFRRENGVLIDTRDGRPVTQERVRASKNYNRFGSNHFFVDHLYPLDDYEPEGEEFQIDEF